LILKEQPNTHYLIAGDGTDRPRLKELALSLGIAGNVHFLGYVSGPVKNFLLQNCDLFLMPTRAEGFGIAFIEAMIHGMPVVAGNRDASKETIQDHIAGIVVDPESTSEIAEAVVYLLDHPEIRKRMGAAGKRRVENNFMYSHFRDRVHNVLRELL
jgi:glycosyltransferase involved in cell wall biosynthesis